MTKKENKKNITERNLDNISNEDEITKNIVSHEENLIEQTEKINVQEIKSKLLKLLNKERELLSLVKDLKIEDYQLMGIIELMKLEYPNIQTYMENQRYMVAMCAEYKDTEYNKFELHDQKLRTIKLGLISDTHLASKYDQVRVLNALYDEFESEKIKKILHVGDITDGFYKNRDNHIYELRHHGADEQTEYVIKNYPKRDKMKTLFITGNHDFTHVKNGGTNIGKAIASNRDDMIYLGPDYAQVIINKCRIDLYHPGGGSAYALSYKLQKRIDNLRIGTKPNIIAKGHFHKTFYMFYRGIHAFEVPSVQAPTPFSISKNLGNDMGAWILTIKLNEDGTVAKISPQLIPVYKIDDLHGKRENYGISYSIH